MCPRAKVVQPVYGGPQGICNGGRTSSACLRFPHTVRLTAKRSKILARRWWSRILQAAAGRATLHRKEAFQSYHPRWAAGAEFLTAASGR